MTPRPIVVIGIAAAGFLARLGLTAKTVLVVAHFRRCRDWLL